MELFDKRILIVGATGMLGQPVAQSLKKFGLIVRVFSRSEDKARKLFGDEFEFASGDIGDIDSLKNALKDCYGVHINLKGGPKPKDYDRIEHKGTAAIVKAASEVGIKRITYLSGATVSKEQCWFAGTKAKYNAEQVIMRSGLDYIIFRASWFMESLPLFIRGNQASVMGKQPHKIHWLAAEDYASMVSKAYLFDEVANKIFYAFGPETYTMKEALEVFCGIINPDIKVTMVPLGVLSFFAKITFSKQLKEVLPLMRYFDKTGEQGDPSCTDEIFGAPQITLEQWSKDFHK
jgi:uncharacterized protein YbjT (DUF2867 family)